MAIDAFTGGGRYEDQLRQLVHRATHITGIELPVDGGILASTYGTAYAAAVSPRELTTSAG
jgi:hypothetical protein